LVTDDEKARKVRHRPSVVADHQAYLHELMARINRAAIKLRLKESLAQSGLKQHEMADILHVHVRSVEDYVSPKNNTVPFDRLDEWGAATGVSTEWLLHGDAAPIRDPLDRAQLADLVERLGRLVTLLEEERKAAAQGD
jgi:transcriptional regulator with XRE-family HTH domain